MTDRYAVFGNPIAHSRSPEIHHAFAVQTAQQLLYEKQAVPVDGFADALMRFREEGGRGLNVTLPFKEVAYAACTELSRRAQRAGAVNTIYFRTDDKLFGHSIFGDNTDGIGLVSDLETNLGISLRGQRLLLLGASGAARGALQPLLDQSPSALTVVNRTASKAEQLVADFASYPENKAVALHGCGYAELPATPFDIIINATSASVHGEVPPITAAQLAEQACCYDMYYSEQGTAFLTWAAEQGVQRCHDGLGMLVEQAAAAFELWRGVKPQTKAVIEQLRAKA